MGGQAPTTQRFTVLVGAAQAGRSVVEAADALPSCRAVATGPGRYSVAWSRRPRWCTVVGGLLALPTLGASLLLLLVRRTDGGVVAVADEGGRVEVRLQGLVHPAVVDALRALAAPERAAPQRSEPAPPVSLQATPAPPPIAAPVPAPVPPVPALVPPAVSVDVRQPYGEAEPLQATIRRAVPRPEAAPEPTSDLTVLRRDVLVAVMDTGDRVTLDDVLVVGREPRTTPADEQSSVRLLAVDDPLASKTHLSLRRDGGAVWLLDRYSTNGTWVEHPDGSRQRVEGGVPVVLPEGARVLFGDRTLTLVTPGSLRR